MKTPLLATLVFVATTSNAVAHPGHEAAGDTIHLALGAGCALVTSLAYLAGRAWSSRRSPAHR